MTTQILVLIPLLAAAYFLGYAALSLIRRGPAISGALSMYVLFLGALPIGYAVGETESHFVIYSIMFAVAWGIPLLLYTHHNILVSGINEDDTIKALKAVLYEKGMTPVDENARFTIQYREKFISIKVIDYLNATILNFKNQSLFAPLVPEIRKELRKKIGNTKKIDFFRVGYGIYFSIAFILTAYLVANSLLS